jgi:cytosine/adenosine deaminase-related metal-dependent hydrolase
MSTLLIRNAALLVTMDDRRAEIRDGGMFIRDGWIERVGQSAALPPDADQIVDLSGFIVFPGLINTHHHLFQTLHRAAGGTLDSDLVGWLKALYPKWANMTPENVRLATEIGLAELALSGCTTVADHHYLWPNGNVAQDQIDVARRAGLRFHLGRGFQSLGAEQGGFAPPSLIECNDDVLADCEDVVARFHDPKPGAMTRVFIAPSSIRSVSPDLLRQSARLARTLNVGFHMHLGETAEELEFIRREFGCRPVELAEQLGCMGENSWVAHGVHFNEEDIHILLRNGCGVCHCPSSNMILGSGAAPVQQFLDAGVPVGLGTDGAASNDSSNIMAEARLALLLSRVTSALPQDMMTPRQALEIATVGGAQILNRDEIGSLKPGCAADFAAIRLDRIELLGAQDTVAALIKCVIGRVDHSWVHGRPLVTDGVLQTIDIEDLARRSR